jgi:serpin B
MLFSRAALLALLALSLGTANIACTAPTDSADQEPPTDVEDVTTKISTAALVRGNSSFATDLYGELATGKDNVFFSPYSISAALGMTYAGARTGTKSAMKGALHLPAGNVDAAFHGLGVELAKRNAPGLHGDAFQLTVVNSLWGEKTQHIESSYLKLLEDNYGAGMELADFIHKPDAERARINAQVADDTNQKIKDLLPSGILKSDTKLVLVNAIYFKASWDKAFTKELTKKEPFTTLSGSKVDVDMMAAKRNVMFAAEAGYEAVAVPYIGGDVELVAIAPKAGTFAKFERDLDGTTIEAIYRKLAPAQVNLFLPKFKVAGASVKLKDALTKLGMGVAFSDDANLSGITGKNDTKIGDVVHKAFINLDEKGTEAAAATAVIVIGKTAVRPSNIDVRFNRPFIFAIRDVPTGAILFLGRVANPKE